MNKRTLGGLALILCALCTGCPPHPAVPPGGAIVDVEALQECAIFRSLNLYDLATDLEMLYQTAEGSPQDGVTFGVSQDAADPPHTYDFSVPLDLDGDGAADATVSGKVTFSDDPDGGLQGLAADVSWTLVTTSGSLTGNGELTLSFPGAATDIAVDVSGSGVIRETGGEQCEFSFLIPASAPLRISYSETRIDLAGAVLISLTLGEDVLSATLNFSSGSNTVNVPDAMANETIEASFDFEIDGDRQPPPDDPPTPPSVSGVIVFTRTRGSSEGLQVANLNTDPLTLTGQGPGFGFESNPDLSWDGTRIAYQGGFQDHIFVVAVDGFDPGPPLTTHGGFDGEPAWSPDGTKIAFTSDRATTAEGAIGANTHIFVINADGSGIVQVTTAAANDSNPAWSPDLDLVTPGYQGRIAFQSDRDGAPQIYSVEVDIDGNPQAAPTNLSQNGSVADRNPNWSRDGSEIVFSRGDLADTDRDIWVMDAGGSSPQQLTSNAFKDRSPHWSPDGMQIAFSREDADTEHLYAMNADGSGAARLLTGANANDFDQDSDVSWR